MTEPKSPTTPNNVETQPSGASTPSDGAGRFSYEGLERVLHERARLGILTSLAAHPGGLLFNDLKLLCSLTDGNLSRHLKVLHDAGLVEFVKGARANRPSTSCKMTDEGRERFLDYVSELERVVGDALKAARDGSQTEPQPQPSVNPGLSSA